MAKCNKLFLNPRRKILLGFILMFVSASCRQDIQSPMSREKRTTVPGITAEWPTYTNVKYDYAIPIPPTWMVDAIDSEQVRFRGAAEKGGSDTIEPDEYYMGGINIVGRDGHVDLDTQYVSAQPNHSRSLAYRIVNTPVGAGRVYTLERDQDRFRGDGTDEMKTWRAQHAYIPVKDLFYEVWVQVGPNDVGDPTFTLAKMLAGFQLKPR